MLSDPFLDCPARLSCGKNRLYEKKKNIQNAIFWLPWQHDGYHGNGSHEIFWHRSLCSLKSNFMPFHRIYGPWERFLVAMTTVVMVTTIWLFFRPFGPKAHLHAKFREDRAVNPRENMRRTFALYIYNSVGLRRMTYLYISPAFWTGKWISLLNPYQFLQAL